MADVGSQAPSDVTRVGAVLPPPALRVMRVAGGVTFVAALSSFIGWVANLRRLTDWDADGISIQANAALSLIFASLAVLSLAHAHRRATRTLAVTTGLIGAATFYQHLTGTSLGIDTLLVFNRPWFGGTVSPGRMGVPASLCITLTGLALLLATGGRRARRWTPVIGVGIIAIAALSLIGALLGARNLHTIPEYTAIATQTSAMLIGIGVALVVAVPEVEPARTLLDNGAGGRLIRRTLPLIVAVSLVLAWLRVEGEGAGLFDASFGVGLLVLALIAFLCGLLWWSGGDIRRREERQREADRALRQSEERFRTLCDASPAVIWFSDTNAKNIYVNRPFLEYFGKTEQEIMGDAWQPLVHPDDRPRYTAAVLEAIRDRRPLRSRVRVQRHDGQWRWIESHALPRYADDGTFLGLVGYSPDINDLVEAQDQLRAHRQELEHLVDSRTAQLRALTVQLTQVEQRERRQLAEFLHDGLQQIIVAAQMHLNLAASRSRDVAPELAKAGELLTAAVKSSRSLTVELSPPVLYERGLIAALRWLVRHVAEQFGQSVELEVDEAGEPADADARTLLFLCVRELLFNARKHATAKRVTVRVGCAAGDAVSVIVEDDGKGFDPAEASRTPTPAGFGLFAIRERLHMLGGELKIQSTPGRGSRMLMTVPRRRVEPVRVDVASTRPQTGEAALPVVAVEAAGTKPRIRVLIADDHAIIRQGLSLLMQAEQDLEVVGEAADGAEAVVLTQRLRPHVVVMDVTMPNMNGIEAMQQLVSLMPEVRVVALSMHSDPQVATAMINAGASGFLIKDRVSDDLIAAIRRIHNGAPQS